MAIQVPEKNTVDLAENALRRKLLGVAIRSPEYCDLLGAAADRIRRAAQPSATEATIEGFFEREVYALLRNIGLKFEPEKESAVYRHTAHGRIDSRLGALVIEYKRPSFLHTKTEQDVAIAQLSSYLVALSAESDMPYVGLLTNGLVAIEFRATGGTIVQQSAPECLSKAILLRLTQHVISLALTALTPKNLIRDFCGTQTDGVLFEAARFLDTVLSSNPEPKTTMLRAEWEELFRLSHDDQSQQRRIEERRAALAQIFKKTISDSTSEYRALFALHTAYAVLLKLIAYRTVSDVFFGNVQQDFRALASSSSTELRSFCATLEDGNSFRQLGILNLLEGDFFSWYCDRHQWTNPLAESIREMVLILARYEEAKPVFAPVEAPDLFRELYQATVPQAVRSSFGEVYTPDWLAEHVLDAARPKGEWRALDPCCGSGTFVVAAIARLRHEMGAATPRALLSAILARVVAIDLHPLAVLTTRIHYFIQISNLLEQDNAEFVIPVYIGDAASVPTRVTLNGVECVQYRLKTLKTPIDSTLPVSLVSNAPRFVKLMRQYETFIKDQDGDSANAALTDGIPAADRRPEVLAAVSRMTKELIALERRGWNGIWARILSNFLITACMGRFTVVVGNPPWIDWKNLPAGYRERIKEMCIDRGLFSGAGRTGGINLNICALITHVSMNNWLDDTGRLAFLMPRELVNQASYEGWRRLGSNGWFFVAFHDWTKAGHPFEPIREDFMTFVIGRDTDDPETVPVSCFVKRPRSGAAQWRCMDEALEYLDVVKKIAGQIIPGSTAFTVAPDRDQLIQFAMVAGDCEYIGREGIEFYPQELLLFRYDAPGPRDGLVWLRNVQTRRPKYRIPAGRVLLETKFLQPLVKGPAVGQFHHDYTGLIVAFPYDATAPHSPIPTKSLRRESPFLLAYYEQHREVIDQQTKFSDKIRGPNSGDFYGLARTGPYSFANNYVAFRDNTRWCATVISSNEMPWGDTKRFVFQNHAVSMCERSDRKTIGLDEAHYVCAILNAPVVERFINASSDERSFKIRPPVFVPLYNPHDQDHRGLVAASREAHAHPDRTETVRKTIGILYNKICKLNLRGKPMTVDARLDAADRDLAAGRTLGPFDNAEDLLRAAMEFNHARGSN